MDGGVTWEVLKAASGILKDFNKQTSTRLTQPGWEVGKSSHAREVRAMLMISSWLARAGLEAEGSLCFFSPSARAGKHRAHLTQPVLMCL